jgi:hypothetical protein
MTFALPEEKEGVIVKLVLRLRQDKVYTKLLL